MSGGANGATGWRVAGVLALLLSSLIGYTVSQTLSATAYASERQMILTAIKSNTANISALASDEQKHELSDEDTKNELSVLNAQIATLLARQGGHADP